MTAAIQSERAMRSPVFPLCCMRRLIAAMLCCIAASAPSAAAQSAQPGRVTVGRNVQVSAAYPSISQSEGLVAADLAGGEQLLGCTMMWADSTASWITVAYHSADNGKSWKPTFHTKADGWAMDPTCAYGPDGTAYLVTAPRYWPAGARKVMTLWRSRDGGVTWDSSGSMGMVDRHYLAVDGSSAAFRNRLYVHGAGTLQSVDGRIAASDLVLYTSTDNGRTFHATIRAAEDKRDIPVNGNSVVLSDGTWVGVFGELRQDGAPLKHHNISGEPNARLKVMSSTDGGNSLKPAVIVDDFYYWWLAWNGSVIPYIAADPGSSQFRDRLYVVWPDDRTGHLQIRFAYSADRGRSWSKSIAISEEGSASSPRDQLMPMLAVNKDGVVGVAWQDRRDAADNLGWSVRFRASLDGGETFLPSVRVSDKAAAFGAREKWAVTQFVSGGGSRYPSSGPLTLDLSLAWSHYTGGHTSGMAVDRDGVFHAYWVDNRTGVHQVWTAPITVDAQVARNGGREWSNLVDVSMKVSLDLKDVSYDRAANALTFKARLLNTSPDTILGPGVLRIVGLESDAGVPELSASDIAGPREGAMIYFGSSGADAALLPGGASPERTLTFVVKEMRQRPVGEGYKFRLVKLTARVLAKEVRASGIVP